MPEHGTGAELRQPLGYNHGGRVGVEPGPHALYEAVLYLYLDRAHVWSRHRRIGTHPASTVPQERSLWGWRS